MRTVDEIWVELEDPYAAGKSGPSYCLLKELIETVFKTDKSMIKYISVSWVDIDVTRARFFITVIYGPYFFNEIVFKINKVELAEIKRFLMEYEWESPLYFYPGRTTLIVVNAKEVSSITPEVVGKYGFLGNIDFDKIRSTIFLHICDYLFLKEDLESEKRYDILLSLE